MNNETKLSERFVGLREVAEALHVHTRTVYRLIQCGLVPKPVKIGHSVRFPVSAVELCIERIKQSAKGEK
jgi:excisionase family DNA binding protein